MQNWNNHRNVCANRFYNIIFCCCCWHLFFTIHTRRHVNQRESIIWINYEYRISTQTQTNKLTRSHQFRLHNQNDVIFSIDEFQHWKLKSNIQFCLKPLQLLLADVHTHTNENPFKLGASHLNEHLDFLSNDNFFSFFFFCLITLKPSYFMDVFFFRSSLNLTHNNKRSTI